MEEKRQIWSTADIIKNRNNWTLASDGELLKHIRSLSEKFAQKSHSVSQSLSSFENDVYNTCTSVANINNQFEALSDTQFVENKVRDDGCEIEDSSVKLQSEQREISDNITGKLNEALGNGIQVLRTQYDIIAVTDSDSEEDEPPEVLLKARNPFMSRRLPFIIGSEEFSKHDHLGLVTSSEDEEDEKESDAEDEGEEDDNGSLGKETSKPNSVMNDIIRSRTQVIQISSESEDSEHEKLEERFRDNIYSPTTFKTSSFASHDNVTLPNTSRNSIPPLVGDVFSSPPLPKNDDNQSMSDDERSDNYSDIFAPFKKENNERIKSNTCDKVDNVSSKNVESNTVFQKSSNMSDTSQSSEVTSDSEPPHTDIKDSNVLAKARGNKSVVNMFSAINAELNHKFNKKAVAEDDLSSTQQNDFLNSNLFSNAKPNNEPSSVKKSEKSLSSTTDSETIERKTRASISPPTSRSEVIPNIAVSRPKPTSRVPPSSDVIPNSGVKDMSSGPASKYNPGPVASVPSKSSSKPKVVSLFDDDDSLEELFNSKNVKRIPDPMLGVDNSQRGLFDGSNDLFSNNKVEERMSEKSTAKTTLTTTATPLRGKTDLFGEDSDSGDDIFTIIRSQKKSAPVISNLENDRKLFPSKHDHKFEKEVPTEVPECGIASSAEKKTKATTMFDNNVSKTELEEKNTSSVKSVGKISQDLKSKNKPISLFDTDDESDDLFHVITKTEKESTSSNNVLNPKHDENLFNLQKDEFKEDIPSTNENLKNEKSTESKIVRIPTPDIFVEITEQSNLLFQEESCKDSRTEETPSANAIDEMLHPEVVKNSLESDVLGEFSTETKISKLSRQFEGPSVPPVNTKSSSSNNETPIVKVPAKLAANRCLNINVNALLPGSNWSSITKSAKENDKESVLEEPLIPASSASSDDAKSVEKSSNLSATVAKDRLKVSVRRRPPSRRARLNKALQSDLFATNPAVDVDGENSLPKNNETDSLLLAKEKTSSLLESEPPSIGSLEGQKELVRTFEEQHMTISGENKEVDNTTKQRTKENKTANDLGNILITASSSREPPALIDDISSLLDDTDKDDYLFDDVVIDDKNISDSIPDLDRETNDDIFGVKLSPSSSPTKIAQRKGSTSFDPLGGEHTNASLRESKISSVSDALPSQTLQTSSSSTGVEVVEKLPPLVIPKLVSVVPNSIKNEVETKNSKTDSSLFPLKKDNESHLKKTEKLSSDLFSISQDESDDDLDELFSKVKTPSFSTSSKNQSQSSITSQVRKDFKDKIFVSNPSNLSSGDDVKVQISDFETTLKSHRTSDKRVSLPSRFNKEAKKSLNIITKNNTDLFAEDDDDGDALFSSNNKQFLSSSKKPVAKSLFEDDDDDDDSLFGSTVPSHRKKSAEIMKTAKSKNSVENMRVVKLRSQTIEEDPLTGEIIKK